MKKKFIWIAILFLPGGVIIGLFHLLKHSKKDILEFFSKIKNKFLSRPV